MSNMPVVLDTNRYIVAFNTPVVLILTWLESVVYFLF